MIRLMCKSKSTICVTVGAKLDEEPNADTWEAGNRGTKGEIYKQKLKYKQNQTTKGIGITKKRIKRTKTKVAKSLTLCNKAKVQIKEEQDKPETHQGET